MQEAVILFKNWFLRIFKRRKNEIPEQIQEPEIQENPFLPKLRYIMEQVLEQKGITYREMKLLLIDSDTLPESLLDEDDIEIALDQMSADLNYLTILTDRPAYFQEYADTMYEENGLAVHVGEKETYVPGSARTGNSLHRNEGEYPLNLVIDFEQKGGFRKEFLTASAMYIPVYKKKWETSNNLDISVPIGYNTVIVKGNEF